MPDFNLLTRKGVDPYKYMDGFDKFNEETLLPRKTFYRRSSDEHISNEDYNHAQNMWSMFGCKN